MSWQPIDTAPKNGQFILLHVPEGLESGVVTVGAYRKEDERGDWGGWLGMDSDTLSSWCEPTHWMALPGPPDDGCC